MAWMGLIVDEVNGVIEIFNILNDELKRYMCSTGATRLKDINPTMVMKRDYILP
jgi:isopentenyl diphosphate isomerase/L-lactate dehydrogenase-like FMN-dependent dehydrogenase